MTDVFISYAREDRDRAELLAGALGALGWSVWWDRKIVAGQAFDHAIEHELETAKSVVVLWSTSSIGSEWVKNEAAVAAERGVLIPAVIESVKLPLEFRRKQTADMIGWKGDSSDAGFRGLCEGIAQVIGGAPHSTGTLNMPYAPLLARRRGMLAVGGAVAIAVTISLSLYAVRPTPDGVPSTEPRTRPPDATKRDTNESRPESVENLADLVAGSYDGAVISDSKGSSRSNIGVTITRLDAQSVRVTSSYARLGTVDVQLTRSGNQVLSAEGDTPFIVDLDRRPPTLTFNPHNEVAYAGTKRQK